MTEPGWDCSGGVCHPVFRPDGGVVGPPPAYCGDSILEGAEECDDGASNSDTNYGGCGSHCVYLFCGDGVVNGDERCDLGQARNITEYGDAKGCTRDCKHPHYCGDGVVDKEYGEMCDPGSALDLACSGCMYVLHGF